MFYYEFNRICELKIWFLNNQRKYNCYEVHYKDVKRRVKRHILQLLNSMTVTVKLVWTKQTIFFSENKKITDTNGNYFFNVFF